MHEEKVQTVNFIYFFQHKSFLARDSNFVTKERLLLQDLLRVPEHLLRVPLAPRPPPVLQHLDGHRADPDESTGKSSFGAKHQRHRHAQNHQVGVQRTADVDRSFDQQKWRRSR